MNIDLRKVKKRAHQEVDQKGKIKSKKGGWGQKNMVPINRKIHLSLKKRMEKCVKSNETTFNTETEILRIALDKFLKNEGF